VPGKGFSLIEIVLAAAIMAIVGGFGLFSLSRGPENAQSRGMAQEIAEELKAARQQAVSQQIPVAICFPSQEGSNSSSQAFYQLEGIVLPRLTRSRDYSQTYPKSCFFWGRWADGTLEDPATSGMGSPFKLSDWNPLPAPDDFVVYFSPAGTVQTNGLALYPGDEYRLLVSNGVEASGAGANASPLAVSKAYTVRLSQTGAVSILPGVVGAPGIEDHPSARAGSFAHSHPHLERPSGPIEMSVSTVPGLGSVASGASTVVPKSGYVTLLTTAYDPSGDQLSVWWEAEGPHGGGKFSSENRMLMNWDASARKWTSRIAWTPPEKAEKNDRFLLTCFVKNSTDRPVSKQLGVDASVEVVNGNRLACIGTSGDYENYFVAWMNAQGTNVTSATFPAPVEKQLTPVWAPNGDKLAYYSGDTLGEGQGYEATLYIVNDDGTNHREVFSCVGDITDYMFGPSFSPEGAYVAFSAFSGNARSRVWVGRIYGNNLNEKKVCLTAGIDGPNVQHRDVSWHPKLPIILYTRTKYEGGTAVESGIHAVRYPNQENWPLVDDEEGGKIGEAHWAKAGNRVAYTRGRFLWVQTILDDGHPTPAPPLKIPMPSGGPADMDCTSPRFDSHDSFIAVIDKAENDLWICDVTGLDAVDWDNRWTRLTRGLNIEGFNWDPEGHKIVFTTTASKGLYTVHVSEKVVKEITPPGYQAWSTPSWWIY
jgi:type II secretory pathway pseudopilin PulG